MLETFETLHPAEGTTEAAYASLYPVTPLDRAPLLEEMCRTGQIDSSIGMVEGLYEDFGGDTKNVGYRVRDRFDAMEARNVIAGYARSNVNSSDNGAA